MCGGCCGRCGPVWSLGSVGVCESDWLRGSSLEGLVGHVSLGWDGGPDGSGGSCWSCGSCRSGVLGESAWLGGSGWSGVPSLACSGYSLAILSDPKVFSNGNIVFDDPKYFDDL